VCFVFPLFYYLIQANSRYRVPIQPILLIGTAEILLRALRRLGMTQIQSCHL